MTDDQITIQPANIGEVNLTLRYMQKGQDAQAALLKEMNTKLDGIIANSVSSKDFSEYKNHVEKTFSTIESSQSRYDENKSGLKELKETTGDHETRLRWVERIAYAGLVIVAGIEFYLNYIRK